LSCIKRKITFNEVTLKSVVVIEDDAETQNYIKLVLKSTWRDVEVIATSFGEDGVRIVKEKAPQAVILDIGLPDINGIEALKKIRSVSDCPVLVLTINGITENKLKALSLGASSYMTKPFEPDSLTNELKKITKHSIANA